MLEQRLNYVCGFPLLGNHRLAAFLPGGILRHNVLTVSYPRQDRQESWSRSCGTEFAHVRASASRWARSHGRQHHQDQSRRTNQGDCSTEAMLIQQLVQREITL